MWTVHALRKLIVYCMGTNGKNTLWVDIWSKVSVFLLCLASPDAKCASFICLKGVEMQAVVSFLNKIFYQRLWEIHEIGAFTLLNLYV